MIGDPQRLQYLEAMGIASWTSRYRFVNAKPTAQVEWEAAPEPEEPAPGQRLQALLETPARPVERNRVADESSAQETAAPLSRARALLGGDTARAVSPRPSPDRTAGSDAAAVSPASKASGPEQALADVAKEAAPAVDPLRFTLSLSVIGERWWLMLPGERLISAAGQTLLGQMLKSVGMPAGGAPLSSLTWPLMDMPASDPIDEAREGIQVFCAGQARRHGMNVDGAIVVGDEVWSSLLSDPANEFEWACHHLPHPDDLLASANAKRECWPLLQAAGSAWQQGLSSPE
ncbi:hypothetical protein F0A16_05795 [Salinicola corii]|uniref:Uncharacterized protein n=1 Tax=Salinicola corii TaxID=2606937 RepID=A0A640WHP5_9GAMM|nr:hypothetical protein [Salinicola corii]KAA0019829.1 hypothetical protein F0A16_05795 [Salinicola corii]